MVISAGCQNSKRLFRSQGLEARNRQACKDLSQLDRSRSERTAVLPCVGSRTGIGSAGFAAGGSGKGDDGSTLPVLRQDSDDRTPGQPREQPLESQVASQPEDRARGHRWSQPPRLRLHPLYPVGKSLETDRETQGGGGLGVRSSFFGIWERTRLTELGYSNSEK
jgi:hypothetical protein